jgi:signal transduction histidine kinase
VDGKTGQDLRSGGGRGPRRTRRLLGARATAALEALDHIGALLGLDAGWVVRSATPGLERLIGSPYETAVGRSLRALLAPATADATIAALAEAVQAGNPAPVAGALVDERPVLLVPLPIRGPSAEIYVLITDLVIDVDALAIRRATAEVFRARLLEIEEQLAEAGLLFEIEDDIATSLDLAEVLPRVAEHAARLCRAQRVAVELLDPESGELRLSAVSGYPGPGEAPAPGAGGSLAGRAVSTGVPVEAADTGEEYHRYAGGEDARFGAALAVPVIAEGESLGALVFCRRAAQPFSESEVRRAQQLAHRAALAIRNARRHTGLTRQVVELREAQAQAVRAEKLAALGRLAAGAAHEINNPLAAIVGNAELLLRRELLPAGGAERVERILHSAYRVARIVKQLLSFVRAQPLELAPTDVTRVLRDVVADRKRDAELEGVRFLDELEPLPSMQADAAQLGQVFANILDNALDAVGEQPNPEHRVIRLASRARGQRVEIRVENTGPPIADAVLPNIFDPFFTTKGVGRGAGLGLSVCEGIVAAHGGRIRAENTAAGVVLVIELPLDARGEAAPPAEPAQPIAIA